MLFDDILAKTKPRVDTETLCLDGEVQHSLEDARRRLSKAEDASDTMADDEVDGLVAEVAELEARVQAASHTFTVRALPFEEWRKLVDAHPRKEGVPEVPLTRTSSVPVTLISPSFAACVDDIPDVESAEQLIDRLAEGQVVQLFRKIGELNVGGDRIRPT